MQEGKSVEPIMEGSPYIRTTNYFFPNIIDSNIFGLFQLFPIWNNRYDKLGYLTLNHRIFPNLTNVSIDRTSKGPFVSLQEVREYFRRNVFPK